MEKLKDYINDIAKLFGFEYNDEFFAYLKEISKPNNRLCHKEIKEGEGGWKCLDCEIDESSLLCNDCMNKSRDKHKGHKVIFDPTNFGFCDCGDQRTYIKEGFCTEHKGAFTNMNDLMSFIQLSINEQLLNNINPILNKIFQLFIE